jgi:acyl carrier protein
MNVAAAADEIRAVIRDCAVLPVDIATLSDTHDLYAAGLTSHAAVTLMLSLEEKFDIEFPDRLLQRRTFASVAAIEGAVADLLDAA